MMTTAAPLASLNGRVVSGGMVDAGAALLASEDGELELRATPSGLLEQGKTVDMYVSVNDLYPVTGATVTGSLDGKAAQAFLDPVLGGVDR